MWCHGHRRACNIHLSVVTSTLGLPHARGRRALGWACGQGTAAGGERRRRRRRRPALLARCSRRCRRSPPGRTHARHARTHATHARTHRRGRRDGAQGRPWRRVSAQLVAAYSHERTPPRRGRAGGARVCGGRDAVTRARAALGVAGRAARQSGLNPGRGGARRSSGAEQGQGSPRASAAGGGGRGSGSCPQRRPGRCARGRAARRLGRGQGRVPRGGRGGRNGQQLPLRLPIPGAQLGNSTQSENCASSPASKRIADLRSSPAYLALLSLARCASRALLRVCRCFRGLRAPCTTRGLRTPPFAMRSSRCQSGGWAPRGWRSKRATRKKARRTSAPAAAPSSVQKKTVQGPFRGWRERYPR